MRETFKSVKSLRFIVAEDPEGADRLAIRDLTAVHLTDHAKEKPQTVRMSPLSTDAARAIVQVTLGRYNKKLDSEQMELLVVRACASACVPCAVC